MHISRICYWLRLNREQLRVKPSVRVCWICELESPLDLAHVVPLESVSQEDSDRAENLADLCPNHHRQFDFEGLDCDQVDRFYANLSYIVDTCGGMSIGECDSCVYSIPLPDSGAPFCSNERLRFELFKINSTRLRARKTS